MRKFTTVFLINFVLVCAWVYMSYNNKQTVDINITVSEDVLQPTVTEAQEALNIIPAKTLKRMSEDDWKIVLLNDFSDVAGYEHISDDSSVVGLINFKKKTITVKGRPEYNGTVKNVMTHELCHYIDQAGGWLSNEPEFAGLYEKYKDGKYLSYAYADITLTEEYTDDILYATSSEKEFFAETLKDYYMHQSYLRENYEDIYQYYAAKGIGK